MRIVVSLPERDAMFRARPDHKHIAKGVQAVARAYRRSIKVEDVRVTFGRARAG